jgi:hypothetical protein
MFWRRRLPHWVPEESIVFVTGRLAGTMPRLSPALLTNSPNIGQSFLQNDRELDGITTGPQWLKDPRVAAMFVEALLYGETALGFYALFAWVVMPNHVHLVLQPHCELSKLIRWLKAATAVRANRIIGRTGRAFWRREYFDRWIRSEKELGSVTRYVENNPVSAGLAISPEEWPWSSAWGKRTGD